MDTTIRRAACLLVLFAVSTLALAQQQPESQATPSPAPQTPQANPDDVKSIDAIVHTLYDVISGNAGQKRDWDRFRSLFIPNAKLIPAGPQPSGHIGANVISVEDFITHSEPFLMKEGFFENEIARRTEEFNHIAHLWSTYESRRSKDAKPFARGINSIQLLNDGQRWWVVDIFWEAESAGRPIPKRYEKSR